MTHESVGAGVDHDPIPVERIVESGLCIGCGLCASIAGQRRIRLVMTQEGRERPAVLEPLDRETLALINAVCPGVTVVGPDPKATDARAQWDAIWGPAIRIAKGYAGDPQVRFQASAGGGLSALAIYLLEKGEVDFILHVAASREKPMRSERHLSFDRAQVLAGAGSRYGPAAPLTDFVSLLEHGRPFAVIAKPCDLAAIRNLANEDPRVDRLVRYHLGFVCGGASVFAKSLELVRSFGLEEDDVAMLRYRGMGNPGKTRVEAKDGRAFEVTYNDLWEDESKWMLQFRCKICPDAIGELADIAVSDVWPGGVPSGEDAGFNGFIARTPRGLALLEEAERAGRWSCLKNRAMLETVLKLGLPTALCTIYDGRLPDPRLRRLAVTALSVINDCITRQAFGHRLPLIDLRLICDEDEDYANPIEPSVHGGDKIAAAIASLLAQHDFARQRSAVFT